MKKKISGEVTYETKRSIVKQLVREGVVCTTRSAERDIPEVSILVKFVFSYIVNYTDMRANHNLENTVFNGKVDQNIEMTIGNTSNKRIRWARIQKGWLIKTLAAKIGIDSVHLSQLEGKTTGTAAMKTLRKLATKLEQPVWFLDCFAKYSRGNLF